MTLFVRGKKLRSAKLNQYEQEDQANHQSGHRPLGNASPGGIGTLSPNPIFDHGTAMGTLPCFVPDFFATVRAKSRFICESSEIVITGFFVWHEQIVPLG